MMDEKSFERYEKRRPSLYRRADIKGKTLILLRFSLKKKTLPGFLPRTSAVCEKWHLPISVLGKLARVFIRSAKPWY